MKKMFSLYFVVLLSATFSLVNGHGYLYDPVARSSAWLVDPSFKECCSYPNHMEMFCGGIGHQYNVNDGKCGICGEPYDKPVKIFEKGGALYKGKIVKTYTQGQTIDVQVMLTANHKGFFEFRVCSLDASPNVDATQDCLDQNLLKIADTGATRTKDVGIYGSSMIPVRVQLPPNLACKHCVFQWKYTAANSWGTDAATGESGPGKGRENETFMGCSDIAIVPNGTPTQPPSVIIPTNPTPATSRSSTVSQSFSSSTTPQTPQTWWPQSSSTWWSQSSSSSTTPQTPQTWWPQSSSTWWSQSSSTSASSTQSTPSWWPQSSSTSASSTQSTPSWWSQWSSSSTTQSQSSTTTTTRPSLGLTTWSGDLVDYQVGDEVMYDGVKYRCVAPHRSFRGSEPSPLTWAWWKPVDE